MAIAKQSLVSTEVKKALHSLSGEARDYDPLLKLIHGARFCLLETNFLLTLRDDRRLANVLREPRLERAIGVIYLPQTERQSHYFDARLSDQFDAVIHFDETRALEPLERYPQWENGEPPETFPTGV